MSDLFASQSDYDRLVALVGPKEAARRLRRSRAEVRPNDIEFSAINAMGDVGEDGMENDGTDFAVAGEDAADGNANDGVNLAVGPKADAYADWERRNAAFMEKAKAQRLAQFDNAKAYIEQNYRGPGLSEQLFAISQALLSPRKMPGFSGTLANISPVFTQIAKAQRTAAQERAEALMKLQQQYQSGEIEAQGDVLKNELALMRARAAANKPQYIRTEDPSGKVTITPVFPNGQPSQTQNDGPTFENTRYIKNQTEIIKLPPEIKYFIAVDDPNQTPRPIPGR